MRLNNRELNVVVEEIYNKVSKPLVDKWEEEVKNLEVKDEVVEKYLEWKKINDEIRILQNKQQGIQQDLSDKTINGYKFSPYVLKANGILPYINHIKETSVPKPNCPTREDISNRIILSGYAGIPELIERLIEYYGEK